MKKLFAGLVLSLAAVAAMAMPRPSDIENALAAHDYQTAKAMTQEVLRERPDSARAHLFNAYVLLRADNNRGGAAAELKTARMLDTNHSVQNSSLFGRTVAELDASPAQHYVPQQPQRLNVDNYIIPVQQGPSPLVKVLKWMFWLSVIGILCYIVYKLLTRNQRQVYERAYAVQAPSLPAGGGFQPTYVNHGRTYDAPPHPVYMAPAVQPSTVVVNSGNSSNGLVEGMMLNEMMHSHHNHADYGSPRIIERDTYIERTTPASPAYEAPARYSSQDYETERSSYSSSSSGSDSWSSSSSSSSSSDSWSSSDSSSSYDGGSSSGSNDW